MRRVEARFTPPVGVRRVFLLFPVLVWVQGSRGLGLCLGFARESNLCLLGLVGWLHELEGRSGRFFCFGGVD